jgi:hypothetical protein|tara:strand:+ start:2062 stop:2382 length:321 start_codon:yes stop_codon:yes gene_type:complete
MNLFYDTLPCELQEKIIHDVHKLLFKNTIKEINSIEFRRNRDSLPESAQETMVSVLYKTDMSKEDINSYFLCIDWLDGKKPNLLNIEHNLYYTVFRMYYSWFGRLP